MRSMDSVFAEVAELLVRFTSPVVPAATLRAETRIVEDLHIPSMRIVDVVLDLEDRFGITVDDEHLEKLRTAGEIAAYIHGRLA